ncbi:collagen alpha-1(XXII) chain-like [Mytilus californianus]|uniref:collagen alpha-1(XXII) chain-like n=1 Tax=Mytilus californianus TaxID=6549 RepID=UPI0022469E8E|nr:collagen alpha-1(XXII) chain-like [Mytilus californianus]
MRMLIGSILFILLNVITADARKDKCEGKRDIVFLLDMSGSVGKRNFQIMLNTVASIADNFYIGPFNTQIGVDVFSSSVKTAIKLKDYNNRYYLERAIKRIKYEGGMTNTYLGLNHVRYNSFSYVYGHRYHAPRIAIVLTDGKSQHKSKTLNAARNLKNAGVKIFSVGIGSGIDWSEVHGIASTGRKRAVFRGWSAKVQNFKELSKTSFKHQITEVACSVGSVIKTHDRFDGLRVN